MDKVDIDFETKVATITMKEGATLSEDDLAKSFKDSQFTVEKFEQESAEDKEGARDAEGAAQAVHKATITGMQ